MGNLTPQGIERSKFLHNDQEISTHPAVNAMWLRDELEQVAHGHGKVVLSAKLISYTQHAARRGDTPSGADGDSSGIFFPVSKADVSQPSGGEGSALKQPPDHAAPRRECTSRITHPMCKTALDPSLQREKRQRALDAAAAGCADEMTLALSTGDNSIRTLIACISASGDQHRALRVSGCRI